MADKYIDTSLSTGLNDGTSLANAWRSLIDVFKNTMTFGSIIAGDNIYVRTHDGSVNCTEALTVSITMATPTSAVSPTTFIFDDGTIWPDDGVFVLDTTVSAYQLTFLDYINFGGDGENHRFEVYSSSASSSGIGLCKFKTNAIDGLCINAPSFVGYALFDVSATTLINFKVIIRYVRVNYDLMTQGADVSTKMVNPQFVFLDPPPGAYSVFRQGGDGSTYEVIGGGISGNVSDIYTFLVYAAAYDSANSKFIDFQTGNIAGTFKILGNPSQVEGSKTVLIGSGSPFNYHEESLSKVEFKQGENYPYLNSILPNAASEGWSYKVSPWSASKGFQYSLPPIIKAFNQTAGIKTLTLEFLLSTAFTNVSTDSLSASFFYIDDATGEQKTISTFKVGGLLDTSTATWSNTAYGAKFYNKYKIEVITPTSIRQGTKVTVRALSGIAEVGVDDFWFMDPDVTIS